MRAIQSHDPERLLSCRFPRPCEHESPSFSLSWEKRENQASHPFALSSSPSASTETGTLARSHDDSFRTRPQCFSTLVVKRCVRPTSAFQPPASVLAPVLSVFDRAFPPPLLSEVGGGAIEGRGSFTMPVPVLAGPAATRAGLDRRSSVHDFTKDIPSPSSTPSTARIEIASSESP